MPTASASKSYRPIGMIPELVCNHPEDVAEVNVVGPYRIWVRFHDGTQGSVDLAERVVAHDAGVFASLADPDVFAEVGVELGAVTWANGIDLAPDAMYAAFKTSGEWILE